MPAQRHARAGWASVVLALSGLVGCSAEPSPSGSTTSGGTATSAASTSDSTSPPGTSAPPSATPSASTDTATGTAGSTASHTTSAATPGPDPGDVVLTAARGSGANPVIEAVDDATWASIDGVAWSAACPVGRDSLRVLSVNHYGFDGGRHRARIVLASAAAEPAARAFSRLYDQRFPIRQARQMDASWGPNPKGPGADDYASMAADNTSAFNCRYVGGEEASKRWSTHAYGLAIDVNPFENPYVSAHGQVYPDPYFLDHRTAAGTFTSATSPATRAFTDQGFTWGGTWAQPDLQHFQYPRQVP